MKTLDQLWNMYIEGSEDGTDTETLFKEIVAFAFKEQRTDLEIRLLSLAGNCLKGNAPW